MAAPNDASNDSNDPATWSLPFVPVWNHRPLDRYTISEDDDIFGRCCDDPDHQPITFLHCNDAIGNIINNCFPNGDFMRLHGDRRREDFLLIAITLFHLYLQRVGFNQFRPGRCDLPDITQQWYFGVVWALISNGYDWPSDESDVEGEDEDDWDDDDDDDEDEDEDEDG